MNKKKLLKHLKKLSTQCFNLEFSGAGFGAGLCDALITRIKRGDFDG